MASLKLPFVFLFGTGIFGVITRKHTVLVLASNVAGIPAISIPNVCCSPNER